MAAQKNGVGDRTNDPGRNSLRLLPSGPDRVGEGPVRRRPPTALYQVPPTARQVSGENHDDPGFVDSMNNKDTNDAGKIEGTTEGGGRSARGQARRAEGQRA